MAGQKTLLNFFQKQTPVKRALESTSILNKSSPVTGVNKENEIDEAKVDMLIFTKIKKF